MNATIPNSCYTFSGKHWLTSASMNTPRVYASMSSSKSKKLFVTGGQSENEKKNENSAEMLSAEHGWEMFFPFPPVTIFAHCSVFLNSTTLMLIGGVQNDERSSATYLINTETRDWSEGPRLKKPRMYHNCARIRMNGESKASGGVDKSVEIDKSVVESVIVVGGWDGSSHLSSVEILDEAANEWREGLVDAFFYDGLCFNSLKMTRPQKYTTDKFEFLFVKQSIIIILIY